MDICVHALVGDGAAVVLRLFNCRCFPVRVSCRACSSGWDCRLGYFAQKVTGHMSLRRSHIGVDWAGQRLRTTQTALQGLDSALLSSSHWQLHGGMRKGFEGAFELQPQRRKVRGTGLTKAAWGTQLRGRGERLLTRKGAGKRQATERGERGCGWLSGSISTQEEGQRSYGRM